MVASHRSIIAGAVLLVASAAGANADYYGGMKDMPVATIQPASWYVRGDTGYSWMDAGDLSGAITPFGSRSLDHNWAIGGGIGYYFGRGIRGDVTYDYRFKTDVHGGGAFTTDFDVKSSVILANLYYDFRPTERFTPYIGVGLGAAYHSTSGGAIITCGGVCLPYDGDSNWTAAGALMAGFSIRLDRGSHAPVSIKDGPVVHRARPPAPRCRLPLPLPGRCARRQPRRRRPFPTPGPRLDDVTAQEIRVGLRWDIR